MWPDQQTILQIIIFLFFAGAAIVQVLFRVLAKGAQRSPPGGPRAPGEAAPGRGPAEKPFRDVREFLKEIRAEAERAAAGRQSEERKTPPGEELVWEVVEERKAPPPSPPGAPARHPGERPGRPPPRGRDPAPARPAEQAAKPGRSVHEYLEELARRERRAEEEAQPPGPLEGPVPAGELEIALGKLEGRASGKGSPGSSAGAGRRRTRPHSAPLLEGLTLRDAMIAQVILGPPRSAGPRRFRR